MTIPKLTTHYEPQTEQKECDYCAEKMSQINEWYAQGKITLRNIMTNKIMSRILRYLNFKHKKIKNILPT